MFIYYNRLIIVLRPYIRYTCLLRAAVLEFYLLLWGSIIRGGATIRVYTVYIKAIPTLPGRRLW